MSYLRQPSPLSFEPLSPSPSEVVTSDSEYETDSDSRKAKRRRVEDLGRQYLAGRPLFIQSAGLRGPFDKGWTNPWKKPRGRSQRHGSTNGEERLAGQFLTAQVVQSVAEGQLEDGSSMARSQSRPSQRVSQYLDKGSTTASVLELAARPQRITHEPLVSKEQEQRGPPKEVRLRKAALPQQNRTRSTVEPALGLTGPLERPHQERTPRSLISAANEWLKSDEGYLAEQPREEARSPTPTPTLRAYDRRAPSGQYAGPCTPTPGPSREAHLALSRPPGFTPINVPSRNLKLSYNQDAQKRKQSTSRSPSTAPVTVRKSKSFGPGAREGKSMQAGALLEAGVPRTESHTPGLTLDVYTEAAATNKIRKPSQALRDPASRPSGIELIPVPAQGENSTSPQRPAFTTGESKSPTSYPPLTTARIGGVTVQHLDNSPPPSILNKASVNEHESSHSSLDSRSRVQTVPPSTNMSAFKYRRPIKIIPGPRLESAEASVEASAFEARQAQKSRRLEFASSDDLPDRPDAQLSTAQVISKGGAGHNAFPSQHGGDVTNPSCEEPCANLNSPDKQVLVHQTDEPSRVSSVLQEAQVVPGPAGKDQIPSAPSTNLMETDKQSLYFSTETDDASAHLSTQAAIAKAQLSFKADLASPIKQCPVPSPESKDRNGSNHNNLSSVKRPKHNITPFQTFRTPSPDILYKPTPATCGPDEHLSTQQMMDAVTPFAFSTTKKPKTKRISFTTSRIDRPSQHDSDQVDGDHGDFGHSSLDMSTSPERSVEAKDRARGPPRGQVSGKEVSSANSLALPVSYSIEPNGTLKEVFQQDGQVEDAVMDLGAVLDDVGSFLQSWDLEAELKKSTGPATTGTTNPGSRVPPGISSGRNRISRP